MKYAFTLLPVLLLHLVSQSEPSHTFGHLQGCCNRFLDRMQFKWGTKL